MLEIDDSDMEEFMSTLDYFERNFPKEAKQMMGKVGNKAKAIVLKRAKSEVKKITGNYHKAIRRGKVFVSGSNQLTVRVYPSSKIAPHFHLIEKGHRIVTKSGEEKGFVDGKHIFDNAGKEVEREYDKILNKEFDKALQKLK